MFVNRIQIYLDLHYKLQASIFTAKTNHIDKIGGKLDDLVLDAFVVLSKLKLLF
jgi:hypothetical protein